MDNVLSQDEIDACNAAIDHFREQMVLLDTASKTGGSTALSAEQGRGEIWGILGWPSPHRDPFRKLLIHPVGLPAPAKKRRPFGTLSKGPS